MCFQRSGAIIPRSSSFIAKHSLLFPGLLNGGVIDYFMMSLASYSQRILNGLLEQNRTEQNRLFISNHIQLIVGNRHIRFIHWTWC